MGYGVMVTQQILVLFFLVRIRVAQQRVPLTYSWWDFLLSFNSFCLFLHPTNVNKLMENQILRKGICSRWLLVLLGCCLGWPCRSQAQYATPTAGQVDIFMGAELHYRDIRLSRMYEVLVNLTPGVKWNLGKEWQAAAQVIIPVYNDYGDLYKRVRLNMAVLSKELYVGDRHFLKFSGGLFDTHRYGLDVKYVFPVNAWLALEGQVGWTGYCSMMTGWKASAPQRISAVAGVDLYLNRWNTEMRITGGRYIYEDYGFMVEGFRHFRHCSVGAYVEYSDQAAAINASDSPWNGGFKVVMMIPPYRRSRHKVNIRPASFFRLSYNIEASNLTNLMYKTDPEENERERWFNRDRLKWGANTMEPDFVWKGGEK